MILNAAARIASPATDGAAVGALPRNALMTGLFALGLANGFALAIIEALSTGPALGALANTFGVSAIVWVACAVGLAYSAREPGPPTGRLDRLVAVAATLAFLVPVPYLCWLTLSALALYAIRTSAPDSFARRGAFILLAATVPMFWSRAVFSMLSETLLSFDATLVAWLVGTAHSGNTIAFADGSGYLWIAPACSSLVNVSLAFLCWVLFTRLSERRPSRASFAWCLLACAAVIAINVLRLALLALYPQHFELIHGPVGQALANWVTLAAMAGITWYGAQRGPVAIGA
jgi:exosortase/archaeosortase family protein